MEVTARNRTGNSLKWKLKELDESSRCCNKIQIFKIVFTNLRKTNPAIVENHPSKFGLQFNSSLPPKHIEEYTERDTLLAQCIFLKKKRKSGTLRRGFANKNLGKTNGI